MNKKNLPLLLMLAAGIVSCIYTFILQYSTLRKLVSLFIVMLVFYILSSFIIWVVDCFIAESESQLKEEGETVEEGAEEQKDAEGQEYAEGQEGAESQEGTERQNGPQEKMEKEESSPA